jgi:hypothetical protein
VSNVTSGNATTTTVATPIGNVTVVNGTNGTSANQTNGTFANATCNLTSSNCTSTGTVGNDLVINCTNVTTCPDRTIFTSCITNYCTNCSDSIQNAPIGINNTANVTINGTSNGTSNGTANGTANVTANNTKCQCVTCRTLTVFTNGTSNTSADTLYSYANFTNSTSPQEMASKLNNSFQNTVYLSLFNYNNQPCFDQRVWDIFGIKPDDPDYQRVCKLIVNDWGSNYLAFQCTSLFCNNKGFCSTGVNQNNNTPISSNSSTAVCKCINGWRGKRCLFNENDYQYGVNWTTGIGNWLNSIGNNTTRFDNESNYVSLLNIGAYLVRFTPEVENADVGTAKNTMEKTVNALYYSNATKSTPNVSSAILTFVDAQMNATDTLIGVNPVENMLLLTVPNGTNATLFGYQSVPFDKSKDMRVTLKGGSSRRALFPRVLQNVQLDKSRLQVNTDSPIVTVPKKISEAFNSSGFYSMAFIRDPKPMLKTVENYINSQIVGSLAFDNTTGAFLLYPNNTDSIKIELPWAAVPFKLQNNNNYKDNCKIYRWNGNMWVQSNNCTIEDGTDQNKVVIKCANFDIVGVGCQNATSTIVPGTNGSNTNNSVKAGNSTTGSDRFSFTFAAFVSILSLLFF